MFKINYTQFSNTFQTLGLFVTMVIMRFVAYVLHIYMAYEMYYAFRIPEVYNYLCTLNWFQIMQWVDVCIILIRGVFIVLIGYQVLGEIEKTQAERKRQLMEQSRLKNE